MLVAFWPDLGKEDGLKLWSSTSGPMPTEILSSIDDNGVMDVGIPN